MQVYFSVMARKWLRLSILSFVVFAGSAGHAVPIFYTLERLFESDINREMWLASIHISSRQGLEGWQRAIDEVARVEKNLMALKEDLSWIEVATYWQARKVSRVVDFARLDLIKDARVRISRGQMSSFDGQRALTRWVRPFSRLERYELQKIGITSKIKCSKIH